MIVKDWIKYMKKLLLMFFTIIVILTTACEGNSSCILFNKYPFDTNTTVQTSNIFKPGERIYYLVTTPKTVNSKRLLIQVYKLGKNERLGFELVWGKNVKVRDEQVYYYTDYIVLNETGTYMMEVYSKDNPTKLLSTNQFFIK